MEKYKKIIQSEALFPTFIQLGSVDKLASLAIKKLGVKGLGLKLTTLEGSSTFGELTAALTIVGSGRVVTKSEIYPDLRSKFSEQLLDSSNKNPETKILTDMLLKNKRNDIAFVTLGDFNVGDGKVHIGLKILDGEKNIFKSMTLTKADLDKLHIQDISLAIKKQFVADRALRLLLDALHIDHTEILFQPQNVSEPLFNLRKNFVLRNVFKFLKGRKLAFCESATGGLGVKSLTDTEGGSDNLSFGKVLYNTDEKLEAGVLDTSVAEDNLYGRATALDLAKIVKVNKNIIAIGITGLLDTGDTRLGYEDKKPGDMYYTILISGRGPVTEKISLPIRSRLEMKTGLMLAIFVKLLQILIQEEMKAEVKKLEMVKKTR